MNHTTRFDGRGEIYAKARPSYAIELFDYMKNTLNIPKGSVFADIGSGTGIFTKQLLDCDHLVYAVEPNEDMRRKAEEKLSKNKNFISLHGVDSNTGISDKSIDFITVAQAFHWFDADAFKKECKRILKPNGKVFIIYNSRDENAAPTKALAVLCRKYNPEFHGFSNGISDKKCCAFFDGNCEIFRADNHQIYDRQGFINRVLSSSYALRNCDERYEAYLKEINAIFDTFALNGLLTVPTYTVAYIGNF